MLFLQCCGQVLSNSVFILVSVKTEFFFAQLFFSFIIIIFCQSSKSEQYSRCFNYILKGTINLILVILQWHIRFTTVPLKAHASSLPNKIIMCFTLKIYYFRMRYFLLAETMDGIVFDKFQARNTTIYCPSLIK